MKNKKLLEFGKSFFGALIGILIYESVFNFDEPFDNYWMNYFAELILMIGCVIVGIMLVRFLVNRLSLFGDGDDASKNK